MRKETVVLIIVAVLVLVAWDIYVWLEPTPGDTISEIVRDVAWQYSVLPMSLGVLGGHFFWNGYHKGNFWVLVGIVLAVLIFDLVFVLSVYPLVPFLVGMFFGHLFWPQRPQR